MANNLTQCNSVPVPEALPGYKRWLVWAPYLLLLEILTRVTFVGSKKFPLHQVSIVLAQFFPILAVSPHTLLLHPTSNTRSFPLYSPYASSPPTELILFLLLREIHVDCSLIIIYLMSNIHNIHLKVII